ncbi:MAG: MBL fold metallo-hydrolase [Oscillospiraceae bacterium]|jgi:phosphoribosyl 1,2-cyclic phosphodiesterase|nr:MBL fold metallo-hydrolase [Oscillospiraceae bacterium]
MARFCPLFSSSSGNCTYVGGADGGILVDAGVSAKRIREALDGIGVAPGRIGAVFVTHEHIDHISGLRVFCERTGVPVFATPGTLQALESANVLTGKFGVSVLPEGGVEVNGLWVRGFKTSHDAAQSCGYRIETPGGATVAIATDTGCLTPETQAALRGCDLVMLESNHEVTMLQNGPYPYQLKRRILSDTGHLSNTVCAAFLRELLRSGTGRFYLAHLSKENNTPQLAYETARLALAEEGAKPGLDFELAVAGVERQMVVV